MSLIDTVSADIVGAMRARDEARLPSLRLLKTALVNKRVEMARDLTEEEALQVVVSLTKQRRESIGLFAGAGRQDLVDKETRDLEVLTSYLPPPVTGEEIQRLVEQVVVESGATSAKDLGRVMKLVMAKLAGRAVDGRAVNEVVRQKLSGR